ncbi:uncharacterized protein AB675_1057 [Cyphellophora attinorum]|uniref:RING-type domain-containing protein n=1 Tax=Cyphellophora attinorum TaxID=1664694 RepID=A0A0N1NZ56_9EURO|nr:uncharacterized protein AB675_1057 [Phialophora attinorum]KPI38223.1 hypothetical protein AB675_1057 [Phialophora attinorum]
MPSSLFMDLVRELYADDPEAIANFQAFADNRSGNPYANPAMEISARRFRRHLNRNESSAAPSPAAVLAAIPYEEEPAQQQGELTAGSQSTSYDSDRTLVPPVDEDSYFVEEVIATKFNAENKALAFTVAIPCAHGNTSTCPCSRVPHESPTRTIDRDSDVEDCPMCQLDEPYEVGERVVQVECFCRRFFHAECLVRAHCSKLETESRMNCPFCHARWFVDDDCTVIYDQPEIELEREQQWLAILGLGAEADHEAEHDTEIEPEQEAGHEGEQEAEGVALQEADREAEAQVQQQAGMESEAEGHSERAPKRRRIDATNSSGF